MTSAWLSNHETDEIILQPFCPADQAEAKDLILTGLVEHWGTLDPTKNPDLNEIGVTYRGATFLVARLAGRMVATRR